MIPVVSAGRLLGSSVSVVARLAPLVVDLQPPPAPAVHVVSLPAARPADGVSGEVLPEAPHGAQDGPALVTPVVSPPCPGLGADVGVERVEGGEGQAAVVAAQRQLPHRLHRHLRAGLRVGDVVLVVVLQHLVLLSPGLLLPPTSPGLLQLPLLAEVLADDGRLGGEIQSDPQQLHQAAQLLEAHTGGSSWSEDRQGVAGGPSTITTTTTNITSRHSWLRGRPNLLNSVFMEQR